MIHISDCVTLADYDHHYEWCVEMNDCGVIECTTYGAEQRNYVLTVYPHQLTKEKAIEILDANLGVGNYDAATEQVTLRDIFMHGEYVQFVS